MRGAVHWASIAAGFATTRRGSSGPSFRSLTSPISDSGHRRPMTLWAARHQSQPQSCAPRPQATGTADAPRAIRRHYADDLHRAVTCRTTTSSFSSQKIKNAREMHDEAVVRAGYVNQSSSNPEDGSQRKKHWETSDNRSNHLSQRLRHTFL